jgi:ribosomal protein L11 methyltransferase
VSNKKSDSLGTTPAAVPFCRVQVRGLARRDEDVLVSILFEYGCQGVAENVPFTQPDLTYDANPIWNDPFDLEAYFDETPAAELQTRIQDAGINCELNIQTENSKDWLAEWKKGFVPFQLAGDFWIVPSWFETPAEAKRPLFIDPGMAFGTGTHATTQLAAKLLNENVDQTKSNSVLDVGTGTGVLAIMALQKWPHAKVEAIDNDPEAVRVARENLERNNCDATVVTDRQVDQIHEPFDLVIANIIDGVLIRLRADLDRCLKKDGQIILSGILVEREEKFVCEFIQTSQRPVLNRVTKDEWVAYLLGPKG